MGEIVNLRLVKKRRALEAVRQEATATRERHGRTKAQRDADAKVKRARDAALDGARLDGSARDREPPE